MARAFQWFSGDPLYEKYYPNNPLYKHYFEAEWGIPSHDDSQLFELLAIGIFAAGLNWDVAFEKRPAFRQAFHDWNIEAVSQMPAEEVDQLIGNAAIIRNRQKIAATVHNAQVVVGLQKAYGSFDAYLWALVYHEQRRINIASLSELPTHDANSERIAKQMKHDGFKFTGPVAVFAYILSIGLISSRPDHWGEESDSQEN